MYRFYTPAYKVRWGYIGVSLLLIHWINIILNIYEVNFFHNSLEIALKLGLCHTYESQMSQFSSLSVTGLHSCVLLNLSNCMHKTIVISYLTYFTGLNIL